MKNNSSLQVFLAVFVGAFMGTTCSFEVHRYLWPIGLIVGGFVGYIVCEPKKVMQAIGSTWQEMAEFDFRALQMGKRLGLWLGISFHFLMCFVNMLVAMCVTLTAYCALTHQLSMQVIKLEALLGGGCISFFVIILPLVLMDKMTDSIVKLERIRQEMKERHKEINLLNITRGLFWLLCRIPVALGFVGKFLKNIFVLIHSQKRLICLTDAAIGVWIGHHYGGALGSILAGALTGAFLGGLIGILNYKVVSVRILHLRPV